MARQAGMWVAVALALTGPATVRAETQNSPLRELQLLRKRVVEQDQLAQTHSSTNAPLAAPTFAALEKLYLDGKISARQFQQYLREYQLTPGTPAADQPPKPSTPAVPKPPVEASPDVTTAVRPAASTGPGPTNDLAASPPGTTPAGSGNDPALNRLAEMEAKMDQILQQRAVMDKARTNKPPTAAEPKTKRERLDALLRALIAGEITEAEYKARWSKIVAEQEN